MLGAGRKGVVVTAAVMVMGAGVTGCSSSTSNGPEQVAAKYVAAYSKNDLKTACQYVDPAYRAKCTSAAGLGTFSGQNLKVHKTVISGDRALVSVTGTICVNGSCQSATDPQSGMPNQSVSFDQAWNRAVSSSSNNAAASAMKRVSGKWYIADTAS